MVLKRCHSVGMPWLYHTIEQLWTTENSCERTTAKLEDLTHTTRPRFRVSSISMMGFPSSPRTESMLNIHSIYAMLMKRELLARCLPTHILKNDPHTALVSEMGSNEAEACIPPPKAKCDVSLVPCVHRCFCEPPPLIEMAFWLEFWCVGTPNFRISVHRPHIGDADCAGRDEIAFIPIVLKLQH